MKPYDHKSIEKKWQESWNQAGIYKTPDTLPDKENYYALVEFSYPSGNLHVGHWYAFAVPDMYARYKRMRGYNVLYPMGFDAFGLPAENAAIKSGADPKVLTYTQMDTMRAQLRSMGAMFDWDREVVSCDPEYYRWTQWMFNQFLKNDLVYRDTTTVNWCEYDKTVLANEQVVDGTCDRCGNQVIQRNQQQWMLRITRYADRLVDDLDNLNWPSAIKESQKNWIGRSEGSEIDFKLSTGETMTVFTTRADTLFGVSYVVLAPEHALLETLKSSITNWSEVENYIQESSKKSELDRQQSKEKTGIQLQGIYAINPANGEQVPVWTADYVLAGYGTGAVMAVPAHDERDFEFAKKYGLPNKNVIDPIFVRNDAIGRTDFKKKNKIVSIVEAPEGNILSINWGNLGGRLFLGGTIEEGESPEQTAVRELIEETGYFDAHVVAIGEEVFDYKYFAMSKGVAHQAYTKYVHIKLNSLNQKETILEEDEKGKFIVEWVTKEQARIEVIDPLHVYAFKKFIEPAPYTGEGSLGRSNQFNGLTSTEARTVITEFVGGRLVKKYRLRDWGISRQRYWGTPIPIVYDPEGNAHPVPDEHLPWLLPTDVDHTPDGTAPLARSRELLERTERIFGKGWRPEVETMDTFVDSSWYFYRYLDAKNNQTFADIEKIKQWTPIDLYMGGAEHTTMHLLYSRFWVKALYDLGLVPDAESYTVRRNRGLILGPDGNKMSKSKGNVINPDEIVELLGADTVRMYLGFMGPYGVTTNYPWDPNGVVGVRRFLERVWKLQEKVNRDDTSTSPIIHKLIKGVAEDIEEYKFNTAIAKMMGVLNTFEKSASISIGDYQVLLRVLAPFAPHITEEIWEMLGEQGSIHLSEWPAFDPLMVVDDTITLGVQVNGKVRAEIEIAIDESTESVQEKVLAIPEVIKWVGDAEIKKFIYVPKKIISIVV